MAWFEQLKTYLRDLYLNSSSHAIDAFKPAFHSFFDEEHQTFRLKMFHNLDQLRLQLERENLLEVNPRTCVEALRTQFKEFFASKRVNSSEHLNQCWQKDFKEYTFCEPDTYRRDLLENLDTLEAINSVQAVDDSLIVSKSNWIESKNNNALGKSVNETQLQQHESFVTESTTLEANLNTDVKALDAGSVIIESSGTKSDKHDTYSSSGTYITHAVDADIRPVNDQVPFAEVQLTAQHNVLANEQQHTEQSESIYDAYLLEKVNRNTTHDSTNMCHKGGEIDQNAEQDQESPEFREFFEINDLKDQLQAKTILICNLKNQIKSVKEASNEANVKHDIDVLETINIELESSVAKLLAENEKLNKENEHLKQTYKELYDSIKKTRIQTKDPNDSLIAQLQGNSVDIKFAKPSILEKPVLQPPRNQSVVRQPNAFKSERPNFSKPRFASQVDVNNVLSKPVTPYYLPKVREYVLAKPHHVIAPGSFRNSQEEPYGSNDMAHNHYLEEARKKTQERNRNSKPSVMHTTSLQNTTNGSKPNTRSNNQISRSLPVSKSSCGMSNGVSLVDHSRNSSSFSDSKKCVCSICHKYIFNTNHDDCITKILNKVNSRAKIQSPKIKNNNPVEPKNHTHKPGKRNGIGQRFSLNKSSAVHEKPHTPRSYLRWKPTGRIFKTVSLRWIPTGKVFIDSTTKVDSEPPNGSNDDITNPYECNQTLYEFKEFKSDEHASNDVWTKQFKPRSSSKDVWTKQFRPRLALQRQMASADISSGPAPQRKERSTLQCALSFKEEKSSYLRAVLSTTSIRLVPQPPSPTPNVPPTKNDWDLLFCPMLDEYFNPSTSTSQTTQEEQSHVIPTSVEEDDHGIKVAYMDNDL
ncbi:hypothetical protein Tco_0189936 [Tanacetum coccineum]